MENDFVFNQPETTLYLPDRFFPPTPNPEDPDEKKRHEILEKQPMNKLFVITDLIKPQQIGTKYIPYMQIMDMPKSTEVVSYKFKQPVYLDLNKDEVQTISISLQSEFDEVVQTGLYPTVVTINFKAI